MSESLQQQQQPLLIIPTSTESNRLIQYYRSNSTNSNSNNNHTESIPNILSTIQRSELIAGESLLFYIYITSANSTILYQYFNELLTITNNNTADSSDNIIDNTIIQSILKQAIQINIIPTITSNNNNSSNTVNTTIYPINITNNTNNNHSTNSTNSNNNIEFYSIDNNNSIILIIPSIIPNLTHNNNHYELSITITPLYNNNNNSTISSNNGIDQSTAMNLRSFIQLNRLLTVPIESIQINQLITIIQPITIYSNIINNSNNGSNNSNNTILISFEILNNNNNTSIVLTEFLFHINRTISLTSNSDNSLLLSNEFTVKLHSIPFPIELKSNERIELIIEINRNNNNSNNNNNSAIAEYSNRLFRTIYSISYYSNTNSELIINNNYSIDWSLLLSIGINCEFHTITKSPLSVQKIAIINIIIKNQSKQSKLFKLITNQQQYYNNSNSNSNNSNNTSVNSTNNNNEYYSIGLFSPEPVNNTGNSNNNIRNSISPINSADSAYHFPFQTITVKPKTINNNVNNITATIASINPNNINNNNTVNTNTDSNITTNSTSDLPAWLALSPTLLFDRVEPGNSVQSILQYLPLQAGLIELTGLLLLDMDSNQYYKFTQWPILQAVDNYQ